LPLAQASLSLYGDTGWVQSAHRKTTRKLTHAHVVQPPQLKDLNRLSGTLEDIRSLPTVSRSIMVVATLAAAKLVITIAMSGRYWFHRDEPYYIACSRHLALGYVDFPPVTPLLARMDEVDLDTSLISLRLLPALAGPV
jgi:hypothetical protein